jgi:hypothetical protein
MSDKTKDNFTTEDTEFTEKSLLIVVCAKHTKTKTSVTSVSSVVKNLLPEIDFATWIPV